jgi:hypothetical protein
VLHPVDRYADYLDRIEEHKQMTNPDRSVFVSVVTGVPPGYEEGGISIPYADDADPEQQAKYGIGPGCTSDDGTQIARPPARLRALAEARGARGTLLSVCADDFSPALDAALAALAPPPAACFPRCAADTDLEAPGLQAACTVEAEIDGFIRELPPCIRVGETWQLPSEDAPGCYALRTHDFSIACIERGSNLELELVYRAGVVPGYVGADCELSSDPETDCPDL